MPKEKGDLYNETFPKRLRETLDEKKMSITALSEKTGIARQQLGTYTRGETTPKTDVLVKIARALNVSADYLLGLSATEPQITFSLPCFETYYEVISVIERLSDAFGNKAYIQLYNEEPDEFELEGTPAISLNIHDRIIIEYYDKLSEYKKSMNQYKDNPVLLEALNQACRKLLDDLKTVYFQDEFLPF